MDLQSLRKSNSLSISTPPIFSQAIRSKLINSLATIVGGTALVLSTAGSSSALSPTFSFSSPVELEFSGNYNIGTEFTVGSNDIVVDQLGFYDKDQDGLQVSHQVGIWDVSTQSLVASTTIPSGTSAPLDGFFRYFPLNNLVTLNANSTYRISGQHLSSANADQVGRWFTADVVYDSSLITVNGGGYHELSGTFQYPNTVSSTTRQYFGGNFSATSAAVPFEFSPTLGLVAMGGIFGLSRLRKRIGNSKAIKEISA